MKKQSVKKLSQLNLVITGKRGYGKTTLAKSIIDKVKSLKDKAIIILDPNNEYTGDYLFNDINMFRYAIHDEGIRRGKSYVMKFKDVDDLHAVIFEVETAFDIYLVLEEANNVTSPNFITKSLKNIVMLGRHSNINYLAVCRRPAEISRNLTSQAHAIISFRHNERNDLKFLDDYGFDQEELKTLSVGDYKIISDYDDFKV